MSGPFSRTFIEGELPVNIVQLKEIAGKEIMAYVAEAIRRDIVLQEIIISTDGGGQAEQANGVLICDGTATASYHLHRYARRRHDGGEAR